MFTHKVDYADLYFQFTKSEGWSLEEGIVKTRQLLDRPGRRRARRVGRQDRVFLFRRNLQAALLDAAAATRTIARAGSRQGQGRAGTPAHRRPLALPAARSAGLARRHRQGQAAGARRKDGARQGPARGAGDGRPGRRIRRGAGRAQRRRAGGRHPPAGARVRHRHRRAERPPRNGLVRRRRPLRLRLFQRRAAGTVRRRSRAVGPRQPGRASGAGRSDDHRARPGLARRAAARSGRPRPGRRLQPQGLVGLSPA